MMTGRNQNNEPNHKEKENNPTTHKIRLARRTRPKNTKNRATIPLNELPSWKITKVYIITTIMAFLHTTVLWN
jgi:hypothetical protein